jgi:hypothetical protein
MYEIPVCRYCGKPLELTTAAEIYPRREDLHHLKFWICRPCDAFIGVKPGSFGHEPVGLLANHELREWRRLAHEAFDPVWKGGGKSRTEAYEWLARSLKIEVDKCHMALFDVEQCKNVLRVCGTRTEGLNT